MPTKEEIVAARKAAGLLQRDAAAVIGKSLSTWQRWEKSGGMDEANWLLFLSKTKAARKKNAKI